MAEQLLELEVVQLSFLEEEVGLLKEVHLVQEGLEVEDPLGVVVLLILVGLVVVGLVEVQEGVARHPRVAEAEV